MHLANQDVAEQSYEIPEQAGEILAALSLFLDDGQRTRCIENEE
jgi:hypothetical protein